MIVELGESVRVQISAHAVARARERLWPALADVDVERRLGSLLVAQGRVVPGAPSWLPERVEERADAFVWLTDEIVCPARVRPGGDLRLLSVLTRGSVSPEGRERRKRRREERQDRARRRRAKQWAAKPGTSGRSVTVKPR